MSINITRDNFQDITPPDYILRKADGERVGVIPCSAKDYTKKFCDIDEISFTTLLFHNNEKNTLYEEVDIMKYVEVAGIGLFAIDSINETSEGTEHASKDVTAKSLESILGQRYLEVFTINMGTVESLDGISFYDIGDPSKSLMHLVLEKATGWRMGHVDEALTTMQRSFEIDRTSIYDFLMNDVSTAFECIFLFDTYNKIINVYEIDNYSQDTNISISYNNLLKNTDLNCSVSDIKTAITVSGSDDLNLRELNMGFETIYNFDYYKSTDYWSQELVDDYTAWQQLYVDNVDDYTVLLQQYEEYYDQLANIDSKMIPAEDHSLEWVNWTEEDAKADMRTASINWLMEKQKVYEQKQAVSMKAGYGEYSDDPTSMYQIQYLPIVTVLGWIGDVLTEKRNARFIIASAQQEIMVQMEAIIDLVAITNPDNFTPEELEELSMFIREDQLSSDNYVVTDIMTTAERFEMLESMLDYAKKELQRISTPQITFSSDLLNLFAMPEFDTYSGTYDVGNYIWVTLRDDYKIKAKLLEFHINFFDKSDFSCTFGNVLRTGKTLYSDIQDVMNTANSVATSVSFNSSNWNNASKEATDISRTIDQGLLAAGKVLTDGSASELIMDTRGLFVNTSDYLDDGVTPNPYAGDSIFIGGGRILFTSDDWLTVEEAVGRIQYELDGHTVDTFGVIAKALIAGLVMGSRIVGGDIFGSNYYGYCKGIPIATRGVYSTYVDTSIYPYTLGIPTGAQVEIRVLTVDNPENFGSTTASLWFNNGSSWSVLETVSLIINSEGVGSTYFSTTLTNYQDNSQYYNVRLNRPASRYTASIIVRYDDAPNYVHTTINEYGIKTIGGVFKGDIVASSGYIGNESSGFYIQNNYIANNKNSASDGGHGVYIGVDAIALGPNDTFKVTKDGILTMTNSSSKIMMNGKTSLDTDTEGLYLSSDGIALGPMKSFGSIGYRSAFTVLSNGSTFVRDLRVTTDSGYGKLDGDLDIYRNIHDGAGLYLRGINGTYTCWGAYKTQAIYNGVSYETTSMNIVHAGVNVSDERLKTDIKDIDEEFAKSLIFSINPKTFKYKNNPNILEFGVIAQDIFKVEKQYNINERNWLCYTEKNDMLAVDYKQLIAPIIKVIQYQQETINDQNNKITELKDEIKTLKSDYEELKQQLDEIKILLGKGEK